jgi:hypothetical protein
MLEIRREAVERGITPLEVMLENMRHWYVKGDRDKSQVCAVDAAPFVHPKFTSIDATVHGETSVTLNAEDVADQLLDAVARRRRELAARDDTRLPARINGSATH